MLENCRLLHQLYWLIFVAYFAIGVFVFPISKFLQGDFTSSAEGRICLMLPLEPNFKEIRGRLLLMSYFLVGVVSNKYFSLKVKICLHGICPKKTMSCIGNYRRNMLSFENTSHLWAIYCLLETFVITMPMFCGNQWLTPKVVFWSHTILSFVFVEIGHGKILPMKMVVPWLQKKTQHAEFYVPLLFCARMKLAQIQCKSQINRNLSSQVTLDGHCFHGKVVS